MSHGKMVLSVMVIAWAFAIGMMCGDLFETEAKNLMLNVMGIIGAVGILQFILTPVGTMLKLVKCGFIPVECVVLTALIGGYLGIEAGMIVQ